MFNVINAKGRYSLFLAMSNNIEYLAARSVPSLAINGANDGAIHPKTFRYCCERVTHLHGKGVTQHLEVPDAGHWVHLEQPEFCADAILAFIHRRVVARQPTPAAKPSN